MPAYGADVSAHQPGFDFEENRKASPFVILKQTEGLTWPDLEDSNAASLLRSMRHRAQAARYVWVGLYHYARPQPERTGRQEADHFISFVGQLTDNEGVVLDFEENQGLDSQAMEQFAIDFVDRIEERWPNLRGNVLFYSYPGFLARVSTDRLVSRCPLYLAAYGSNNGEEHPDAITLDRWSTYCFWQITSNGSLPGYGGRLDVNRFDGSENDLRALGAGNNSTIAPPPPPPETPPPLRPAWPGVYLRQGSRGDHVRIVQKRLEERGWSIAIEGDFGSQTEDVVRHFQEEKSLGVDGIVGPKTWEALWTSPITTDPAPTPAVPPFPGRMHRGSSGDGVRQMQQRLADRGWNLERDGLFGRATETVVFAFQKDKGLTLDGVVGPQTWEALWLTAITGDNPPPLPPPPPPPPVPDPGQPGQDHPDPVGQVNAWAFDEEVYGSSVTAFQVSFAWWDLAVDGSAGPETAKAVQKVVDEGGYLSPHFHMDELRSKGNGRVLSHRETLRTLERERELVGPITVVSGFRDPAHNEKAGGAPNSQHMYGTAIDKNTKVWSSEQAGFTGIGTCGDDCLHGDRRDAGPNNTTGASPGNPTYWAYC